MESRRLVEAAQAEAQTAPTLTEALDAELAKGPQPWPADVRRAVDLVSKAALAVFPTASPEVQQRVTELWRYAPSDVLGMYRARQQILSLAPSTSQRPRTRARSSLTGSRPRARRTVRAHAPPGDDDGPAEPEPEHDGVGRLGAGLNPHRRLPRKEAAMNSRPQTPPPFIDPPMALAIVLEALGACFECGRPVERTAAGFCRLDHADGCSLAADVEAAR